MDSEFPQAEATMLSLSTNWEDRIRAAAMRNSMITPVTLPDGFPCIYEPASSPHNKGRLRPRDHAWVKSADKAMLEELLPLYRELWAAYESGWPQATRRRFEIGALNGLSPYGVYRPGTTAAEVIGETMLTHTGMYATAPEHLKAMHPQHDQWTRPRA